MTKIPDHISHMGDLAQSLWDYAKSLPVPARSDKPGPGLSPMYDRGGKYWMPDEYVAHWDRWFRANAEFEYAKREWCLADHGLPW